MAKYNGFAIASFVLGIILLLIFIIFRMGLIKSHSLRMTVFIIGTIVFHLSIILGLIGISKIKEKDQKGIILSSVGIGISFLILIAIGILFVINTQPLPDTIKVPNPKNATKEEPIEIPFEIITGEVGKDLEFTVSVFNKLQYDEVGYSSSCKCKDEVEWKEADIYPQSISLLTIPGTAENHKFIMKGSEEPKAYTCTLTFCHSEDNEDDGTDCDNVSKENIIGSKQIIIKFQ